MFPLGCVKRLLLSKIGLLNLCAYFQYTKDDPFECEPCNCHGHSDKCEYDAEVDAASLSLDIDFNYEGGGVCQGVNSIHIYIMNL